MALSIVHYQLSTDEDFGWNWGDVVMKGWVEKEIKDVIHKMETINPNKNPSSTFEYIDVSSVCNKRFEIVETSTILGKDAPSRARRLVKTGDILFATIRPTLKRITQVPENLDGQVCSTGYFVLRPKDLLDARFLFYFLLTDTFMGEMERLQKGASYPAVTNSEVSSQKISVPPIAEQKQIVAILDEAFEGIDGAIANTEKNLANARELFETHIRQVFDNPRDSWKESTLGESCDFYNGKAHEKQIDEDGDFIVVNSKFISSDGARFKKTSQALFPLFEGDITMVMSDVPKGKALAKCYLIDEDDKYSLNQRICAIRSERFHERFLLYHLNRHPYLLSFDNKENQTNLRKGDILKCPLYVPEIYEQAQIAEHLDDFSARAQRLEAIYQQKLAALNELKQSILQKAFSGELTAEEGDAAVAGAKEVAAA